MRILTNKKELELYKDLFNKLNNYVLIFDSNYNLIFINDKMSLNANLEFDNDKIFNSFLDQCIKPNNVINNEELKFNILLSKIDKLIFNTPLRDIYYRPNVFTLNNNKYTVLTFDRYSKEEELFFSNKKENLNPFIMELIETFPVPVFYKNKFGIYVNCNQKFVDFIGLQSKSEIIGKTLLDIEENKEIAEIYEERDQKHIENCEQNLENKNEILMYEFVFNYKNRKGNAILYKNIYMEEEEIGGIVGVIINNTDTEKRRNELENKTLELSLALQRDHLTKTNNKLAFDSKIDEKIKYYSRYINKGSFILMILDIDYFKQVNDTYGHNIGDIVLKKLVTIIQNEIRNTDILFRIGGEEFALIIDGIDLNSSEILANKLLKIVREYKFKELNNKNITISIGISEFDVKIDKKDNIKNSIKHFFERTDKALYKAKKNGRNQFQINQTNI